MLRLTILASLCRHNVGNDSWTDDLPDLARTFGDEGRGEESEFMVYPSTSSSIRFVNEPEPLVSVMTAGQTLDKLSKSHTLLESTLLCVKEKVSLPQTSPVGTKMGVSVNMYTRPNMKRVTRWV